MKTIHFLCALSLGLLAQQITAKKRQRQQKPLKGSVKHDYQFEMTPLPYPFDALEPYISKETVETIYGKLQAECIGIVNYLTKENPDFDNDTKLVDIIQNSRDSYPLIYQNAAQFWNLEFFWGCMTESYEDPPDELVEALEQDFGSFEAFKNQFIDSASAVFGSGWTWLVYDTSARTLFITNTLGADSPFAINQRWFPILAMDVWEHAYFRDYQNRRNIYAKRFLERLVDWEQVDDNLTNARMGIFNPINDVDDSEDDPQAVPEGDEDIYDENSGDESGDETASEL